MLLMDGQSSGPPNLGGSFLVILALHCCVGTRPLQGMVSVTE